MGEKKYLQEFECDWIANIEGAIYGDEIAKLDNKRQITRVPYDPSLPVSTSWDLGVSDHSAIIFYQQLGRAINIIDYHEERGKGLPHYIQMIKEKITSTKITLHHTTSKLQILVMVKLGERSPIN